MIAAEAFRIAAVLREDLVVDRLLVGEGPGEQLVHEEAADHHAAFLPEDADRPLEVLRARRRRQFEDAQRAGMEADDGDAGVLALDLHQARRGHAADRFHRSHEPRQHVDVVGALVHEDAAVVRPRPAPPLGVVIRLVAGPPQPHGAEDQPPETPLGERLARLHDRGVVAVLVNDEQLHVAGVARFEHPVRVLELQRHRLFDDDRPFVLHEVEHVGAVRAARRQHGDDVDRAVELAHHVRDAAEGRRAELGGEVARPGDVEVHEGANLRAFDVVLQRVRVLARDAAAAHQGELQCAHALNSPQSD